VGNTEDDGHLHLVRVGENQLVLGTMPSRVQTNRIDMTIVCASRSDSVVFWEVPARVEQVRRLGEDIVVDHTGIDGECTHEQDDVTTEEEAADDFAEVGTSELALIENHIKSREEEDEAVTDITEHDCEHERERDDRKQTGVDLLVGRDTVGVHDCLEALGETVGSLEGRRSLVGPQLVQNGRNVGS
jgi:hypothetical protein